MARTAQPAVVRKRATVLVVDDDQSILKALARLLRSAGFNVQTFERPSLLLAGKLPTLNACLIVDINLPEMNGVELCRELVQAGCRLPMILITGRNPEAIDRLVKEGEVLALLYKPLDEEPLLEAIGRAITLSNSSEEDGGPPGLSK